MKMKNIILGLAFLTFWGCGGFLDIDVPDSLDQDEFWKTADDAEAALTGMYTKLGENIPQMIKWGGLRSDIYQLSSNDGGEWQFVNQEIFINNGQVNWTGMYSGINRANNLLHNIHLVAESDHSFTHSKMEEMKGQAYAVRALYHFYLVRAFRDVPYQSEPYESDAQNPYMAALAEETVLDSIEMDLERALKLTAEGYDNTLENYGYVTKNAVRALWADVKLWRKNYEECIALCEQIEPAFEGKMTSGEEWFSIFSRGNSKESLWEYQYLTEGPSSTVGDLFNNKLFVNREAFKNNVQKVYFPTGALETSDTIRYQRTSYNGYVFKYAGISATNGQYVFRDALSRKKVNFIFYRFREVLLMKAEALGALERYDEAVELVNKIRRATRLEEITTEEFGIKETFFDRLIGERVAELGYEGKDWFTLLRIARNTGYKDLLIDRIARNSSSSVKEQILRSRLEEEEGWFLPYLESEVKNNLLLEQKEFYIGKRS